jgi:outer membrane protein assembly factor BamB
MVHALDAVTGKPKWEYMTRARIDSSPAIADTRAFIGSSDGKLYALDLASGKVVWQHEDGAALTSSPALAASRLVIGTTEGRVLCFA